VANSLRNHDATQSEGGLLVAWRALALAMLEYRRGNFSEALNDLDLCKNCQGQSPACVAGSHLLRSMALRQLGKVDSADEELEKGRSMVQGWLQKKLEIGDDKTGRIQGGIVTPILQHEAESLANSSMWLQTNAED
jgi:eukaryotic-like serine/threonine-protein kinase